MERYSKRRITLANTPILPPSLNPRAKSVLVGERRLPVVSVPNRQTNNLAIVTAPWGETIYRPDVRERLALQAESLQSTVVAVANPGVHAGPILYEHPAYAENTPYVSESLVRLTSAERGTVANGNFDKVAQLQWEAIRSLLERGRFRDARLTIIGNSLGATAAAALAKNAQPNMKIQHLVIVEPITCAGGMLELGKRYLHEVDAWDRYKNERPEWAETMSSISEGSLSIAKNGLHNVAYAKGLTSNDIAADIESAYRQHVLDDESYLTIISGSESHVSPELDNDSLAERLTNSIGSTVRQLVLDGESHGLIDSPNRYTAVMREAIN